MKKIALFLALSFSCSDSDRARSTLQAEGYTAIETSGYSLGCGNDDDTCTRFDAIGPTGRAVHGVVGCGFNTGCSKGCTVRIDP